MGRVTSGGIQQGDQRAILNIIWLVLGGVWLAVVHVTTAIAQAVTIVDARHLPPGVQHPRLIRPAPGAALG